MNDLTKVGLAIGVAMLLVLGMMFKNEPGSYGTGLKTTLQQSEQAVDTLRADLDLNVGKVAALQADLDKNSETVASLQAELKQSQETVVALRSDLENAGAKSESLSLKLTESDKQNTELNARLASISGELDTLKQPQQAGAVNSQDAQTRVATLELEVQGLRDKLSASEASSREIIAGLNARLRASNTATSDAQSEQLLNRIQELEARVSQADALALKNDANSQAAASELSEKLSALTADRDDLTARLEAGTADLEAKNQALASAEATVATLQSELDSTAAERQATWDELKSTVARLDEVSAERDSLVEQMATLEKSSDASDSARTDLSEQLQALESGNQALTEKTATLSEQIRVLSAARDELQVNLDGATTALETARGEIETLSADRERLSAALDSAGQGDQTVAQSPATAANSSEDLIAALNNQFAVAGIDGVEVYPRGSGIVSVRAGNSEIFSPGSTTLSPVGREVLAEVGKVMTTLPDSRLQIEGHTDNIPIGRVMKGLYGSNWDLSVARAMAAVRHLERRVGIGANRLSGAGFGEFMPVATNDTAEGRSQNRRIEIVVYPVEQAPN